jgi:hypothetical protein
MNDREISTKPPKGRKKYGSRRISRLAKIIMIGGSLFIVFVMIALFVVAALF